MSKTKLVVIVFVALTILVSIAAYPALPENVVSHWNIYGQPDAESSKEFMLAIMPLISLFIFALYLVIPKIDPMKQNIKKFETQYNLIFAMIIALLLYIHIITIAWNLGYNVSISAAIVVGVAVMLFAMGLLIKNSERNWFVGVRTPWTLSSDNVWRKTHALASLTFRIAAVILLLGVLIPDYAFMLMLIAVIFAALIPVIYSYIEYRKENFGKEKK